ncbi:MAG: acyl-CoA thioesterase [Ignavibacteria bacterium]
MIVSELKIRVLYAHTDKMGVVYYARYFEYFEAGRNEFLRMIGYPYSKIESQKIMLPVIEAYSKYIAPAKYDELITLNTILKHIPTVRIRLEYLIQNDRKEKLAEGYTVHSFVNALTMKPAKPPADFLALIKSHIK